MRFKPAALVLLIACLAMPTWAAPSVLSRLPDEVVQRLRDKLTAGNESSVRAALRQKMDDMREEDARLDDVLRTANSDRRAEHERAARGRAASHRVEIIQLRDQVKAELAQLQSQVAAVGGDSKAAQVVALGQQVNERFARLEEALQRVEKARDGKELRSARNALVSLMNGLRAPDSNVPLGRVPTQSAMPLGPIPKPVKAQRGGAIPQYVKDMQHRARFASSHEDDRVVTSTNQGYAFVKASLTLPPVAPDAATDCNSTAADLADDGIEVRKNDPAIQALAKSLQYSPVRILQWMLKEVEYEPYWGSLKGSVGVLQTRKGNATDQSSLLISLLRASNIPARYVRGYVDLYDPQPSDNASGRAQRWLGTKNYVASSLYLGNVLAAPITLGGAQLQGVEFEHVWVQACVPFAAYRGNVSDSGGYRWMPLDSSIKDHDYQAGIAVNVPVDDAFYASYLVKRQDQLPTEYLAGKVEAAARTVKSDASAEDVPYRGRPRALRVDVLPSTPPAGPVLFTNWPGIGSPETAVLPDAHRHKFTLTVKNSGGTELATKTVTFPQDVFKRLTVSYKPDAASQSLWNSWDGAMPAAPSGTIKVYPQINLDGAVVAPGNSALAASLGGPQLLVMKVARGEYPSSQDWVTTPPSTPSLRCVADSGNAGDPKDPDTFCLNKTVYTNIKAGSYIAAGLDARQISDTQLELHAKALAQAVQSNPTAPTPASGAAYDATVGELLNLVLQTYINESAKAKDRVAELQGFRNSALYDIGLTSSDVKTSYVFDLPLTVKPAGVYVDFKGGMTGFTKLDSAVPYKPNAGEATAAFLARRAAASLAESAGLNRLFIYAGSALEHHVWQEALRTDAVSTVRGLQFASEKGIPLRTFTSSNIGSYDSLMLMSGATSMAAYKTAITAEVNAGATITVPREQIAYTDPVDTAKAWRGAVYMSENALTGSYGAVIAGALSGGYPLISQAPITAIYYPTVYTAPTFQNVANAGTGVLTTLATGTQGSNSYATYLGDPVNMLTGNFTDDETDFSIKGRGGLLPIVLQRWYNSGEPKDGPMGFGWTHSFNHMVKLYGVEGGVAKLSWTNGSGGENYFTTTAHASGDVTRGTTLVNPSGVEVQFTRVSGGADDGKFRIRERDGTVYLFASVTGPNVLPSATSAVTARLLSITDRNANSLTLNYNGAQLANITDSLARTVLTFTWTGNHITQIADFTGRKVIYAYTDGGNNLNKVTDTANRAHNYSYYTAADGSKVDHHLKRKTLPRGNGLEFEYYSGGQVFRHTPFDTQGNLIESGATTFHYNLFSREAWSVNERGNEHHITFDQSGNPVRIVEENGAIHSYTYDTVNPYNRLTETDSLGRVTRYSYTTASPKNLLETKTLPSGAVIENRDYNSFAQPQRSKDARGNWAWQRFDANGNLTDSIQVRAGVTPVAGTQPVAGDIVAWTKMAYDTVGNTTTVTRVKDFSAGTGPSVTSNWDTSKFNVVSLTRAGNRNGSVVNETTPVFTYDALGRMKTGVDSRLYPVSRDYDVLDRIVWSTDSLGKVHNYAFDANGNPAGNELVDAGARLDNATSTYDARDRLAEVLDYAGNRSFFGYDEAGNRISQTSADNFTVGFEYDAKNRPIAAFDAEQNRVYTQLDTQGRQISVTDPNNNTVTYQYWGASGGNFTYDGRLKRITQPTIPGQAAGRAVEYDYDAAGNVIRTRAVAGDGTSTRQSYSFYDELGRVIRSVGAPDDLGKRLQVCSKYSNLSQLLEVWAGPTTDTTRTSCDYADASLQRQVTNTWDDFGQQLSRSDQLNRATSFGYDEHGNLTSSQSPEQLKIGASNKTVFAYDPVLNGALKTRTVPGAGSAGQVVTYTRNGLGQVTRVETRDGSNVLLVAYDYGYDRAHRLASITDSRGTKSLGYSWTPGGRLAKVTLSDNGTVSHRWDYKYDAVGRLSAIVAPNGQTVSFALDAGGRLRERSFGNGLTTQYKWLPEGSLDSIVQLGDSAQLAKHAYTYDVWGNRKTSADTLSGKTYSKTYGYDTLDRLKTVSTGVAAEQEGYTFDIFGNMATKTLGTPVAKTWSYAVDTAHQLNQIQQTVAATVTTTALMRYDDNGNLKKLCEASAGTVSGTTTDCSASGTGSVTTSFTWDGLDQLAALAKAGTTALSEAYAYDDAGRRIKKTSGATTTHSLYDGQAILAEWTGATVSGAPAAVYANGTGTDDLMLRLTGSSGTPDAVSSAYAQDGIGSVTALVNLSGVAAANQAQVAGNTLATTGDASASFPASQLKDGVVGQSSTTGWKGTVASGAAATLTLAGASPVERMEMVSSNGNLPSTYVVEIQNTDLSWTQVATGTSSDFVAWANGTTLRAVKSFPAITTSAIRVRFTGAVVGGQVWLTELQVWNAPATTVTQRYDAWGQPVGAAGNIPTYGYTGREPDASGLDYYRARYYSPAIGRFISRDPIGLQSGISPYQYADGNPVNNNDPSGLLARNAANTVTNYFGGTGAFAPTTSNNGTLSSALSDTGRVVGNLGLLVLEGMGNAGKVPLYGQPSYTPLPRLTYDTPAFGKTVEALLPIGVSNLISRTSATASFADTVRMGSAQGAANVANGPRLANQLVNESARSPFTATGTLTENALATAQPVRNLGPGQLNNPAIPSGFGKYTTETFQSPAGNFQTHFYMNPATKEVFYGLDYKTIFNSMSGVGP